MLPNNKIKISARYLSWQIMRVIGWGFLLLYLLHTWSGDQFLPARLMNYVLPWWLFLLLPSALIALIGKRLGLTLIYLVPSLSIIATIIPLYQPLSSPTLAASPPRLKIMSYNIFYLNPNLDAATTLIKREQADLVFLQEVTTPMLPSLETTTATLYRESQGYLIYDAAMAQAIISRYPLKLISASAQTGNLLKAKIDTPNGIINVWNVHPPTGVRQYGWEIQHQQLVALAQEIATFEGGPLILAGDFNTTPQSDNFKLINQYLDNAQIEGGYGWGFSFPDNGITLKGVHLPFAPLIRIDHIFYNDYFQVYMAETLTDSGGSDHRPIVAELARVK